MLIFIFAIPPRRERAICLLQILFDSTQTDAHFLGNLPLANAIYAKTPENPEHSRPLFPDARLHSGKLLTRCQGSVGKRYVRSAARPMGDLAPLIVPLTRPLARAVAIMHQVVRRPIEIGQRTIYRCRLHVLHPQPEIPYSLLGIIGSTMRPRQPQKPFSVTEKNS